MSTIIKTKIIFNKIPALAICLTDICPLLKTIAFGGVATGSINAQLAAIAAGITKYIGETLKLTAIAAAIGKNAAVVAKLLVSSVKNIIIAVIEKITIIDGTLVRSENKLPIHSANPLL